VARPLFVATCLLPVLDRLKREWEIVERRNSVRRTRSCHRYLRPYLLVASGNFPVIERHTLSRHLARCHPVRLKRDEQQVGPAHAHAIGSPVREVTNQILIPHSQVLYEQHAIA